MSNSFEYNFPTEEEWEKVIKDVSEKYTEVFAPERQMIFGRGCDTHGIITENNPLGPVHCGVDTCTQCNKWGKEMRDHILKATKELL
tara:strand:+ start:25165 stop:25425 length:261 start_codon:yes stop_codon:yes gene_type:complete